MSAGLVQQVRQVRAFAAATVVVLDELEDHWAGQGGPLKLRARPESRVPGSEVQGPAGGDRRCQGTETGVRSKGPRVQIKVVQTAAPAGPAVEAEPSSLPPTAVQALALSTPTAPVPEPAEARERSYPVPRSSPAKARRQAVAIAINALPAESGAGEVIGWLRAERPELVVRAGGMEAERLAKLVSSVITEAKENGFLQALAPGQYRRLQRLPVPAAGETGGPRGAEVAEATESGGGSGEAGRHRRGQAVGVRASQTPWLRVLAGLAEPFGVDEFCAQMEEERGKVASALCRWAERGLLVLVEKAVLAGGPRHSARYRRSDRFASALAALEQAARPRNGTLPQTPATATTPYSDRLDAMKAALGIGPKPTLPDFISGPASTS